MKQGLQAGEANKTMEIAKNMKSAGMEVDTIHKMIGVSKEEILGMYME